LVSSAEPALGVPRR